MPGPPPPRELTYPDNGQSVAVSVLQAMRPIGVDAVRSGQVQGQCCVHGMNQRCERFRDSWRHRQQRRAAGIWAIDGDGDGGDGAPRAASRSATSATSAGSGLFAA